MLKILPSCLILLGLLISNSFAQTDKNGDSVEPNQPDQSNSSPPSKNVFQMEMPFKKCMTFENQYLTDNKLASDNESLFLPLLNGKLISLSIFMQVTKWETDLGGEITEKPYLFGDNIAIISKTNSNFTETENSKKDYFLRLLNKNNGLVRWQIPLDIPNRLNNQSLNLYSPDSNRLIVTDMNGSLYLLDTNDGSIIAKKEFHLQMSANPFFDKQTILLVAMDEQIILVSMKTLDIIERINVEATPTIVTFFDNLLVWGDDKGRLNALARRSYIKEKKTNQLDKYNKSKEVIPYNQKWNLRFGGKIFNIIPFKNNFLITSFDNYIYLVSSEKGEIIWKRRLPNRPSFDPLLVEDHAVVLTVGDPTALVVELKSGRIVNKVNISDGNFFIGNAGKISSFLYFPTVRGIFIYNSSGNCL